MIKFDWETRFAYRAKNELLSSLKIKTNHQVWAEQLCDCRCRSQVAESGMAGRVQVTWTDSSCRESHRDPVTWGQWPLPIWIFYWLGQLNYLRTKETFPCLGTGFLEYEVFGTQLCLNSPSANLLITKQLSIHKSLLFLFALCFPHLSLLLIYSSCNSYFFF